MLNKRRLLWIICMTFALLFLSESCSKREAPIVVVPGKSIARVELGMSRENVISLLGEPIDEIPSEDISQIGEFIVLGEGTYTGEVPRITILHYSTPSLAICLNEDNKVGSIQLGYTKRVSVEGYDFLKFKYLTKEEIEFIGKPESAIRDEKSEQLMLTMAPQGTKLAYYVYKYNHPGLILGLIFDRTKEQSSEYFIGLNYIAISSGEVLPTPNDK